jgi:hypothetical protein
MDASSARDGPDGARIDHIGPVVVSEEEHVMDESNVPEASSHPLIDAVREGDAGRIRVLLDNGADVAARDGDDWAALDWAAGGGDLAIIRMLLDHGTDPFAVGREQRRPYQIALAAGHLEAARVLRQAEDDADPDGPADRSWRPYCRAYLAAQVRQYPGWASQARSSGGTPGEATAGQDADAVVFLHDDLTVTSSMRRGEDVLFDAVTAEWERFCSQELGFRVPDEMDLVPESPPTAPNGPASPGQP